MIQTRDLFTRMMHSTLSMSKRRFKAEIFLGFAMVSETIILGLEHQ